MSRIRNCNSYSSPLRTNNGREVKRKDKQYRAHQMNKSATDNRLNNHKLKSTNTRLTQELNKMTETHLIDLTHHHSITTMESNSDVPLLSIFLPIGSKAIMRLQLNNQYQPQQNIWLPTPLQPQSDIIHPMASLITDEDKIQLQEYCQFPPQTIILRLTRTPDIKLKAGDIQTLITPGTQTHEEVLIFGLENACKIYGGTYLEPAFFPILQQHGWDEVIQWLSPNTTETNPHYQHPNISIPIHIHGNHWVAVNRRILGGRVRFLYADDLNNAATERTIKQLLYETAPSIF